MNILLEELSNFASWLVAASVKASVVVAIIMIIRLLLRDKLPARWLYALWLLVIVRLVVPFEMPSPLSIFNVMHHISQQPQIEAQPNSDQTEIPLPSVNEPRAIESQKISAAREAVTPTSRTLYSSGMFGGLEVLSLVWLLGDAGFLMYAAIANIRLWRKIRRAEMVTDARHNLILDRCLRKMRVSNKVAIFVTDKIDTPLLYGLFKPIILFPRSLLESLSDNQLDHILLHELAHYKRCDVPSAMLGTLLQALHWFNPVIWLAFYKMLGDREAACDEMVLSRLGVSHSEAYGQTLISLLRHTSRAKLLPVTIGLADSRANLTRRVKMIANFSQKSVWWSVFALLLIVVVAAVALTGAAASLKQEPILIQLGADNTAALNGMPIDVQECASILQKDFAINDETNVAVETSAETQVAAVYELSLQLRQAGIHQVSYKNRVTGALLPATLTEEPIHIPPKRRAPTFFQQNGKWGYADENGTVVIPAHYDEVYPSFIDGRATVKLNGAWGMIDTLDNVLVPFKYEKLGYLENERITFRLNGKWGFLDSTGTAVVPAQYEAASVFYNGFASVQVGKKWGFVNKQGEMVVLPRFDDVQAFVEGFAAVQQNGRWGYVDATDKLVIPCQYSRVRSFQEGLAPVEKNGIWGYINTANEMVIEPRFQEAAPFAENRAVVKVDRKYGVIDKSGAIIIEPRYDMVADFNLGICFAAVFENPDAGIAAQQVHFDVAGNRLNRK